MIAHSPEYTDAHQRRGFPFIHADSPGIVDLQLRVNLRCYPGKRDEGLGDLNLADRSTLKISITLS
ncbi:hypothetical protein DIJ64_08015 [Mycobacterium leprae]|uniref:Uncharacterized protein n=1 Tax=Mycobacterium leprae TaxID=1769 RepID=A0AAD0KVE2_MYCLR|nr:hypothetical protein [Mycobacterium leprae]AWV48031.1 hypothetical protein DIJ64_08015 [Mycobacterium leprae]OAR19774.1 hypothetical protein A8144_03700 [Mycobacterium leprae 3125609]OAX71889.1 hypothetical protein A3216_02745 [Mycobacterium leprae 7935681]